MCGIVGAVSRRNIVPALLDGLKRLEYRGYDSAGLAVVNGKLHRLRSVGRVAELEKRVLRAGIEGELGIAHTRWATHGVPSEHNAHPHVSGGVSVVHNGIIENHDEIRARLVALGYAFTSDTDTEVIAHLVHLHLAHLHFEKSGGLFQAVRRTVAELRGAYAIAVIHASQPGQLIVARHGAPLLVGIGEGENFAASDASALVRLTQRVIYLEDGDCAEITLARVRISDRAGAPAERQVRTSQVSAESVEIGAFRHYMEKEIYEQPRALARTVAPFLAERAIRPALFGSQAERILRDTQAVLILACGTSYHAGMVARYWLESIAGIACSVEIASEYRYRLSVPNPAALVVAVSQSGETADTLAALQHARSLGHRHCLALCNVPESSLVRVSDLAFLTQAGPEIGVASTKAFTTQLASLLLLTAALARVHGRLPRETETKLLHALAGLPAAAEETFHIEPQLKSWAQEFAPRSHALFLGRGIHWPIAMEGALKLKEISYIHAEAYAAGELKHGPLALVDRHMPVVAIAPNDPLFEKLKSNLQEVGARGGALYVLADRGARIAPAPGVKVIRVPDPCAWFSPILHAIPLQLLAYHTAVQRGNDVDKPRNLAKSVTVE